MQFVRVIQNVTGIKTNEDFLGFNTKHYYTTIYLSNKKKSFLLHLCQKLWPLEKNAIFAARPLYRFLLRLLYVRRKDLPFGHDVSWLFPVLHNLLKILLTLENYKNHKYWILFMYSVEDLRYNQPSGTGFDSGSRTRTLR